LDTKSGATDFIARHSALADSALRQGRQSGFKSPGPWAGRSMMENRARGAAVAAVRSVVSWNPPHAGGSTPVWLPPAGGLIPFRDTTLPGRAGWSGRRPGLDDARINGGFVRWNQERKCPCLRIPHSRRSAAAAAGTRARIPARSRVRRSVFVCDRRRPAGICASAICASASLETCGVCGGRCLE
jgi:hypothetical protein